MDHATNPAAAVSVPAAALKQHIANVVPGVAGQLHDQWRNGRRLSDGTFEPRVKTTTDEIWIAAHGETEVDIANTDYSDLPADWQAENLASAQAAADALHGAILSGQPLDAAFVEDASSYVHERWLDRNGDWASDEQLLPFGQLSAAEQQKDRDVVVQVLSAWNALPWAPVV